jgi:PAS domain S-box-containing protein
MPPITATVDENSRLNALRSYHILDTLPEQALDDLTALAATICEVPMAMISLVDEHRQWFKSRIGVEAAETPRGASFCTHALGKRDLLIVPDATQDARFAESPLVTCAAGVRFYAGAPLITPEGAAIGTLCVNDRVPRTLTPVQQEALRVLAGQVMTHLELRRHTRELVESEERLRIVTDNARVGLVIVNKERRYLYANEAYAEILGLPSSGIVDQRVADVQAGVYEEQIRPQLDRAFAGERVAYELSKSTADEDRHCAVRYEPTKADGEVALVVGMVTDITERKRTEESLRESERRFREMLENVELIAMTLDKSGRVTFCNDYLLKVTGWSREEVIGADWCAKFLPNGSEAKRVFFTTIETGEIPAHYDNPIITRHGGLRDIAWNNIMLRDGAGKVVGTASLGEDVTERKRAEMVSLRLAAIVASSDDAIIGKDLNGLITSWNRGAEKIFGYTADEIVGTSIMRLIPADRQAEEEHILGKIRRGESVEHFETLRLTKDGWLINISVTASPIKDATGRVIGVSKVAHDITEAKRVEESLREIEGKFRQLADNITDVFWICSPDFETMHYVSAGYELVWGRSQESLYARPRQWREAILPEERERVFAVFKSLRESEREVSIEYRIARPDGTIRWIHDRGFQIRDAAGILVRITGISTDITERKLMEQARRETQARLNSALAAGSIGTWTWDIGTDRLVADEFTARMFSLDADAAAKGLPAEAYLLAVAEEDRPGVADGLARALECCGHYDIEYRIPEKDGGLRWLQARGRVECDKSGNALSFHGAVMDITERKRAQEQIAEQAAFLDKAQDAIMVRDLEGKILFWNKGAERMYGWAREETMGRNIGGLLYDDPNVFKEVNELTISEGEWHGELPQLTKDKGGITVEARWTLIRDHEWRPKSVLAINTDITEKKKIEAQFLRAQRMESIGTLAGGIAHDLNNVLSPIIMSLDLLGMKFPDPKSRELLDMLGASAQRGADMVRQVLSFARGVEGRRMEVQVKHLVKDLVKIVEDTFLKTIRVQSILPHDLWTVLGDPTQLHQVLLNLCVNARDAMPNGGLLTFSAENLTLDAQYAGMNLEASPGSYVLIQVEDSGSGMPPEVIEKIFDPFFTTKEIGKGTGLGLSTSLAIVKSHGGFVRVYSEPGKGTKFGVYLPAQTETSAESAEEIAAELPRGHGELILVVDDESTVRVITQQTLQAFGYRVILASDRAEAVAAYARQGSEVAVVLTDMMMPVMDGPATILILRKLNPAVRIIAASGLSSDGHATALGVKHFLPKPYTAGTLLKALKQIIEEEP